MIWPLQVGMLGLRGLYVGGNSNLLLFRRLHLRRVLVDFASSFASSGGAGAGGGGGAGGGRGGGGGAG